MTGRGRPRKATRAEKECTKSKTKEIKKAPPLRYQAEDVSEEKRKAKPKEEVKDSKQIKTTRVKEKLSKQSPPKETTTKRVTEANKLQQTPDDSVKAPTPGSKAKTKSTAPAVEKEMPSKTLQDTAKDSLRTPKEKTSTKSPAECAQQKGAKKGSIKRTKTCDGEVRSTVKSTEDATKTRPETLKHTTNACVTRGRREGNAAVVSILKNTVENLKIRRNDRANAAEAINAIKKKIITHLRENSQCFKDVQEPLGTGSYYENVKISNPDEFDVMVPVAVERVKIEKFQGDGAFYSASLKRGNSSLKKFQEGNILSASKMLTEFREEVKKCVKPLTEWTVTKKEIGCPAVTLTTEVQSVTISLDLVLCLMVKSSWPIFTNEGLKIETWLGTKVKQDYKRKPYYLVPKYEGRGTVIHDGVLTKDVWRISFSHVEKAILNNHGSEKTCCEKDGERCCRKECLKLLKHLLRRLKEKDSSFDKFCSYHAKTTLLHACCSRTKDSEWRLSSLSQCFMMLLEDFIGYLENGVLQNFFIPSQNLFSGVDRKTCNSLARCIKEERDKNFPIFE